MKQRWRAAASPLRLTLCFAFLCALVGARPALAHRIDEYLQATLLTVGQAKIEASMRMIPGVIVAPGIIQAIDSDHDGAFSDAEELAYARRVLSEISITVDGQAVTPSLTAWSIPQPAALRDGLGEIHLEYSVALPPSGNSDRTFTLINRHFVEHSVYLVNVVVPGDSGTRIVSQVRNAQQSSYELDFQQDVAASRGRWSKLRQWAAGLELASLFHLGIRHIAEGTDHLLFLLALLLPAPLVAAGSRWGRVRGVRCTLVHILGIVTAFTVGHSITLTLAALGLLHFAGRPVEVLIAVSVLVSAVHALRPLFPGREAWIAACFGLIHGLAFAATLERLGLTRWDRLVGILTFNLGIEAMQLVVVAAILPSLVLLSRTRAYPVFRITGASFAAIAAAGWILERLFSVRNPVDGAVDALARLSLRGALLLLLVSLVCRVVASPRAGEDRLSG